MSWLSEEPRLIGQSVGVWPSLAQHSRKAPCLLYASNQTTRMLFPLLFLLPLSFCLPFRNVSLTMLQAATESLEYLWNMISALWWWQLLRSTCHSGSFLSDSVVSLEESFQQQVKIHSSFVSFLKVLLTLKLRCFYIKRVGIYLLSYFYIKELSL